MTPGSDEDFAAARASVYTLLATVFDGDVDQLGVAIEADVFWTLAESVPGAPDVEPLRPPAPDRSTLSFGYDALFVVPGAHSVPPFASGHVVEPAESFDSDSIYRDDESTGEFLGTPAACAAGAYEQFGFMPTYGSEFPDSLPAMFEFVALLATAESNADEDDVVAEFRANQLAFLEREMTWIDSFADAVVERDDVEGLYATLARFASAFVAFDRELVSESVDETVDPVPSADDGA
ncbi:MAG: TorD/DmsD family molecular chaperone [archaeon]